MRLAGVSVLERNVAALAELLLAAGFEDTGDVLLLALDAEQVLVALSIEDREAILRVLDDPPHGLAELRGVLLLASIRSSRSRRNDSLPPESAGRTKATVKASGTVSPVTFTALSGRLPIGVRLNTKTGVLSGKPRNAGTYRVTIEARDGLLRTAKQTYVLTVRPRAPRRA